MVDELGELGCDTPVLPGVITVTNPPRVKRFADMNGTTTPDDLWNRLEAAGPAERLRIACDQAAGLAAELLDLGAPGIHLYTLNVPEAAEGCWTVWVLPPSGDLPESGPPEPRVPDTGPVRRSFR